MDNSPLQIAVDEPLENALDKTKESSYTFDLIKKNVGDCARYEASLLAISECYESTLIQQVIDEWQDIISKNCAIEDPKKYFISLVHHTVHKRGFDWINDCESHCKYRPENMLF